MIPKKLVSISETSQDSKIDDSLGKYSSGSDWQITPGLWFLPGTCVQGFCIKTPAVLLGKLTGGQALEITLTSHWNRKLGFIGQNSSALVWISQDRAENNKIFKSVAPIK